MENRLVSVEELARYLKIPRKTLYEWNSDGSGPPYLRVGRHVRYVWSDVERWLEQRRRER